MACIVAATTIEGSGSNTTPPLLHLTWLTHHLKDITAYREERWSSPAWSPPCCSSTLCSRHCRSTQTPYHCHTSTCLSGSEKRYHLMAIMLQSWTHSIHWQHQLRIKYSPFSFTCRGGHVLNSSSLFTGSGVQEVIEGSFLVILLVSVTFCDDVCTILDYTCCEEW